MNRETLAVVLFGVIAVLTITGMHKWAWRKIGRLGRWFRGIFTDPEAQQVAFKAMASPPVNKGIYPTDPSLVPSGSREIDEIVEEIIDDSNGRPPRHGELDVLLSDRSPTVPSQIH